MSTNIAYNKVCLFALLRAVVLFVACRRGDGMMWCGDVT